MDGGGRYDKTFSSTLGDKISRANAVAPTPAKDSPLRCVRMLQTTRSQGNYRIGARVRNAC